MTRKRFVKLSRSIGVAESHIGSWIKLVQNNPGRSYERTWEILRTHWRPVYRMSVDLAKAEQTQKRRVSPWLQTELRWEFKDMALAATEAATSFYQFGLSASQYILDEAP